MTRARSRALLIVNHSAGSITPEVVAQLRDGLPRYRYVEYDKKMQVASLLDATARVVIAGGDGAVEAIARQLLHTPHRLGIIPGGTYNNFAGSLGIPADIAAAIAVIRKGRPRAVSVGTVNGQPFMEAAMVGFFGEALQAGEAARERELGELLKQVATMINSPKFEFSVNGDLVGRGEARSLFFANTPRIGARITVANGTPRDSFLEFSFSEVFLRFRHLRLQTKPRVRVFADTHPVGRTPAVIDVDPDALRVIL